VGIDCLHEDPVHNRDLPNGIFMNWTGAQKGEGFEYHILAMALALVVMLRGSAASVDRALSA
jgi:putative oxidoreductase